MAGKDIKPKGKAYKMPEKIRKGEILIDTLKISWTIGDSIGVGGFGEIYAAAKTTDPKLMDYAVKIEPSENGPLFCERTVYINIGKKDDVAAFAEQRKLSHLGIPNFHGFGRHTYNKTDYRFIVIDKLGKDIWSYFKIKKRLPYPTVLKIGIQILDVLEYIHGKGYVHCDVKGTNLLLGAKNANQVYLVDFGLACKYAKTIKPDPKKAHNGTLEYTSRDAHQGVMTRRGDIEVLAYNLLHWTEGTLPWETISNPSAVETSKQTFMAAADPLKTQVKHAAIRQFFACVCKMVPEEEPNYKDFRKILTQELKQLGSDPSTLEFTEKEQSQTLPKKRAGAGDSKPKTGSPPTRQSPRRKQPPKRNRKASPETSGDVKKSWKDCPTIVNGARTGDGKPPGKISKR